MDGGQVRFDNKGLLGEAKGPGTLFRGAFKEISPYMIPIILFISFALYFNTLLNEFVIDDIQQVVENPWIKDVKYIPEIFTSGVWAFEGRKSSYYRPLIYIIYMISFYIFGLKPWGFHLVNVVFHAGVSILVFLLTSQLLKRFQSPKFTPSHWPPFLTALLFVAHPIHTEPVVWVAGVMDVSFTFFYLISLYLYIQSSGKAFSIKGSYFLSVLSFFLATLCKEPALTLPLIIFAYDYIFEREGLVLTPLLKRYIPYVVVVGIYFALRLNALGGLEPIQMKTGLNSYQYFLNIPILFTQYLEKLLLPIHLNVWHVFNPITSFFTSKAIIALLVTIIFLSFTLRMAQKNKVIFFSLLIITIPLLPCLYIPALGQGIENAFTERYLYLPSLGFVLLLGLLMEWLWLKRPYNFFVVTVIAFVVIGFYSVGTITRNSVWKDSYTLWSDAGKKSPNSAIAIQNLGHGLYLEGRLDEAIEQYEIALRLKPELVDAQMNLGVAYYKKGLLDKAIERYLIALKLEPGFAEAHNNLGLVLMDKSWNDKAIEHYKIALKLKPNFAEAHHNLGAAYGNKGMIDDAIREFEIALKLNPDHPYYQDNLRKAYILKGR